MHRNAARSFLLRPGWVFVCLVSLAACHFDASRLSDPSGFVVDAGGTAELPSFDTRFEPPDVDLREDTPPPPDVIDQRDRSDDVDGSLPDGRILEDIDRGEDWQEDTGDTGDAGDIDAQSDPDLPVLAGIGEPCLDEEECLSALCLTFGEVAICSQECDDACEGIDVACFNGWCTPDDYCEEPDGFGLGPGCEGAMCLTCAEDTATCLLIESGYVCVCLDGYSGDGFECEDIDECAEGTHECDPNARCTDADGSYGCDCNPGFTGDGFSCDDVDECAEGTHECDPNARCTDADGSYDCDCKTGFTGDGFSCDDVDECATDEHDCHEHARCDNTDGSFECTCDDGYTGDGFTCTPDAISIEGDLSEGNPGLYTDDTAALSCLAYLEAEAPYTYTGSTGDGYYLISDGDLDDAFVVFCDMTTEGGGWTGISLSTARNVLNGTVVSIEVAEEASGVDASFRPFTRDDVGNHTYHYTFETPFGYDEFYLSDFLSRANSVDADKSTIGNSDDGDFVQSDWDLAHGTFSGDISFGTSEDSGPVTSYAAENGGVNCTACTFHWPGGKTSYDLGSTVHDLRIGWGEEGGAFEGWYPWWEGTIFLR